MGDEASKHREPSDATATERRQSAKAAADKNPEGVPAGDKGHNPNEPA